MITRISGTKNGYKFGEGATNKDFQEILQSYGKIRSIITNADTYARFSTPLFGRNIVTVNNHVGPEEFYLNSVN
jgi:hypothetical protein